MHESFEVCGSFFPAGHESSETHEPSKESFDLPAVAVAIESLRVLRGRSFSPCPMGRNEFDAELGFELIVERVAVVGLVADQDLGGFFGESGVKGVNDELTLMSRTTRSPNGERKAIAVCHCHDLGRFAAASDPNIKAPLFAPAWVPSM